MARVFISHASDDLALACEVHRWLSDDGHKTFLDQDVHDGIPLGEEWRRQLHEQLRRAEAIVCLITSSYVASMWCTAEIAIAQAQGNRLLPLRLEPGATHPLLAELQHTDLTREPMVARAALTKALRKVDATGGATWTDDRSPFPGLVPFDSDRHRVFFGRTEEVEEITELLRSPTEQAKGRALLVVGPSGCGKSSLVRAGLLPVISSEPAWQALTPILPGTDPIGALARELAGAARQFPGLNWTVDYVRRRLDAGNLTDLADALLFADPNGAKRRLLVVIDQFEELLTQTSTADRVRFIELLRPALLGPVQIVGTLRPEFLDELLANLQLAALSISTYLLRPLHREALRLVIEGPARLAGISVEDQLVARLVADTDNGETLPLLAFTLAQLAEGVTRGGQLHRIRYNQLGGVQGALTRQSDAALAEAVEISGRSPDKVIAGLLLLVTIDEQGRPTKWRVRRAELPDSLIAELDTFVARRLLITDSDNGHVTLGIAHEAFLSAWRPLADAVKASASALRARRAIENAAREWADAGHSPSRLWSGGQLVAAIADMGAPVHSATQSSDTATVPPTATSVDTPSGGHRPRRPQRNSSSISEYQHPA